MRAKRAKEVQALANAQGAVTVAEEENLRLATTLAQMQAEAAQLRAFLQLQRGD